MNLLAQTGPLAGAALAGEVTLRTVKGAEQIVYGFAPSLMTAGIAGALAGVFFYQVVKGMMAPLPTSRETGWRLLLDLVWRMVMFGGMTIGLAYFCATIGTAASLLYYGEIKDIAQVLTGLVACAIPPFLQKHFEKLVDYTAERLKQRIDRTIGGEP